LAATGAPTAALPAGAGTPSRPSFDSLDQARFLPGTMVADRYRIVGLLGRGGMGEVYRADDLKLGQPAALKFLPPGLERDRHRLERFLNEVRVALKVTHPNVCRVYDIGDVDGHQYLSMEYVDGEDLASLLKRIGRLPEDKAVQIARQLCAGLAAAHDQGILHRDLKPANVMIDGRGRARITDFGLAGLAAGFEGAEVRAGTPGYMAPEQVSGQHVSARSDIYSLGLVLYELFTGKQPYAAKSVAEIARLRESAPTSPSSHVSGLDPGIERVILRCLEKDPAARPPSALAVAAALPGGDPLAAALAAGETPSPEMVADTGGEGALQPKWAVPILVYTLLMLGIVAWITGRTGLLGRVPMEKPPLALAERASQIASRLGYSDTPADTAYGFDARWSYRRHVAETDPSPTRWDRLASERPAAIFFWYRQSPRTLVPANPESRVYFNEPPVRISGMLNLQLDSRGRLEYLKAVPPQFDETVEPAADPDWTAAFEEAGLGLATFTPTDPRWIGEAYCDKRQAWLGAYPDQSEPEIRVEACSYRGKPVYFNIFHPWDKPGRAGPVTRTTQEKVQSLIAGLLFIAVLIGCALLARRNMQLGRGDRRGALRVAAFIGVANMGAWLLQASHVADMNQETNLFTFSLAHALWDAAFTWLLYMALEPFVRRRWPESIVSWSRLLAGRFRDPLVGRHLLFGAVLGVTMAALVQLPDLLPAWLGAAPGPPSGTDFDTLLGTRWVVGELFWGMRHSIRNPMFILVVLVLFRFTLRNSWVALAALVAVQTATNVLGEQEHLWIHISVSALVWTLAGLFLMYFGLVSTITGYLLAIELTRDHPLTLDLSTWYAGSSIVALAAGVAIILYSFYVCLGGRSLWAAELTE
jgi:serine/threonine-protein kinase